VRARRTNETWIPKPTKISTLTVLTATGDASTTRPVEPTNARVLLCYCRSVPVCCRCRGGVAISAAPAPRTKYRFFPLEDTQLDQSLKVSRARASGNSRSGNYSAARAEKTGTTDGELPGVGSGGWIGSSGDAAAQRPQLFRNRLARRHRRTLRNRTRLDCPEIQPAPSFFTKHRCGAGAAVDAALPLRTLLPEAPTAKLAKCSHRSSADR
jgi:hypothetical protein